MERKDDLEGKTEEEDEGEEGEAGGRDVEESSGANFVSSDFSPYSSYDTPSADPLYTAIDIVLKVCKERAIIITYYALYHMT